MSACQMENDCLLHETELYGLIDDLLASADISKRKEAYDLMKNQLTFHQQNWTFLWQMARTTHLYVESLMLTRNWRDHRNLQFEARGYALAALKLQSNDADVHQWCALTIGGTTRFVGVGEKIQIGYQYKVHIDKAVALRPDCPRLRHLRGRFCFETASLSWLERQLARLIYQQPPASTFQEALREFFEAEKLNPRGSTDNLLQIARCYMRLGDGVTGERYLREAAAVPPRTPEDATAAAELAAMLRKERRS